MASMSLLDQIKALSDDEKALLSAMLAPKKAEPTKRYVNGGKFWTRVPRYVQDRYVLADPEHPALIVFDESFKIEVDAKGEPVDRSLELAKEGVGATIPPKKLDDIPPYAKVNRGPPIKKADGGRPSDMDPAK